MLRPGSAVLALLVFAACASDPDEPIGASSARIVRGQVTTDSPATVFIAMELEAGFGVCTGTLISPRVVITARHCLRDEEHGGVAIPPADIQVMFGNNSNADGNTWITVSDTIFRSDADIGMLTLSSPAPVTPVRVFGGTLGKLESVVGDTVHLVGFGITSDGGSDSGTKRHGYTRLERVDVNSYGFVMITGYLSDGAGTCNGDSGGPNFIDIGGQEVIVGVTSYGTSACGTPEDGAIRTDKYYDWIMDYVATVDGLPDPTCEVDGQCAGGCEVEDPDCSAPVFGGNVIGTGSCQAQVARGGSSPWLIVAFVSLLLSRRRRRSR